MVSSSGAVGEGFVFFFEEAPRIRKVVREAEVMDVLLPSLNSLWKLFES